MGEHSMKKYTDSRGITLLEVLIAMVIISISLLLLLNMGMVALDGNDWSNNTTISTQLLQEKVEQLRSERNTGMNSGSDTAGGFTRSWTVSNAGMHLRRVDVSITWDDIKNRTHTNTMTAYIRTDSL